MRSVSTPVARYSGTTHGKELRNSSPNGVLQDSSGFDIVPANAVPGNPSEHSSPSPRENRNEPTI
jgi:hypothetical protein